MIGKSKILLISTFLLAVFTYSFWGLIKELTGISIFYYGTCLAFVGYTLVIKLLIIELSKHTQGLKKFIIISSVINMVCVNSLVDEVLFDPQKIEVNEYIGFFICIVLAIYENRKRLRDARSNK